MKKRGRAVILAASPNQLKTAVGAGTDTSGKLVLILSVKCQCVRIDWYLLSIDWTGISIPAKYIVDTEKLLIPDVYSVLHMCWIN